MNDVIHFNFTLRPNVGLMAFKEHSIKIISKYWFILKPKVINKVTRPEMWDDFNFKWLSEKKVHNKVIYAGQTRYDILNGARCL